ncbi:fimbrial protein [Vibrio sp. qd031]|uniref:type IV pilus secretin PilQ n=1 Tax=Vibrio sp. qd031 TaxID=1603038 RepID=UPI000A2583E7|nr:type IV pilus secretin PilQ [Vibrio sp. qd031]ORT51822.1 fimbrial protein [Vibrio sp. qd031]
MIVSLNSNRQLSLCLVMIVLQALLVGTSHAEPINRLIHQQLFPESKQQTVLELTLENSAIDAQLFDRSSEVHVLLRSTVNGGTRPISILPPDGLVASINSTQQGDNVLYRLIVTEPVSVSHVIQGNVLIVTLTRRESAALKQNDSAVTLNFQAVPLRQALQILAQHNRINLVMSDSVQGELSINLQDVPWQQALSTILQVKQLEKRIDGNVMLIAPLSEMMASHQHRLQQSEQAQLSGPLTTKLVKLHYAKANDIASMLVNDSGINMLSQRGAVSVDERTNTLLVRDIASNLSVLTELIAQLDVPVKQVQIEARIVTVDEGDLDELGVRWGVMGSSGKRTVSGSIEGNLWQAGMYGDDNLDIDDFLNVNLGLVNPNASSIAFQVAKLGSDLLLDLELSALQAEAKAEIISSPKIITTNKKAAYIEQGTEIPYLEAASSGATSVSFRKAVLSLEVIPQITPDNRLVLDLNVTQDRPGEVVKTGFGEAVAINTQRIGTQVLVNNGETVVLGGIYQQSHLSNVDKVPAFGDIPVLGGLFRRTSDKKAKSELLIFVTPTVIED